MSFLYKKSHLWVRLKNYLFYLLLKGTTVMPFPRKRPDCKKEITLNTSSVNNSDSPNSSTMKLWDFKNNFTSHCCDWVIPTLSEQSWWNPSSLCGLERIFWSIFLDSSPSAAFSCAICQSLEGKGSAHSPCLSAGLLVVTFGCLCARKGAVGK